MSDPIDDLRSWADQMAGQIPDSKAKMATERAMFRVDTELERSAERSGATAPTRVARRLTPVLAAGMVFGLSNVALAAVANPAAPGDALYGVDRAYERVAVILGSGSYASERLDEAVAVLERGQPSVALDLVEEALIDITDSTDTDEARSLIDQLATAGGVSEDDVIDLVEIAREVASSSG